MSLQSKFYLSGLAAVLLIVPFSYIVATPEGTAPADPVYNRLRQPLDFAGAAYSVKNLALKRDAAAFSLTGEIYFAAPIEGRTVAAVFIGTGEMRLTPPIEAEKRSLALFTEQPSLSDSFTSLVLRFTDRTFDEIKSSPQATPLSAVPQASRAKDLYAGSLSVVRKQKNVLGMDLRYNYDARTLMDIYAPQRPGFFLAFPAGGRFNKLVYRVDPFGVAELAPEEVALMSYADRDWGYWTSFHREEEYKSGSAPANEDHRLYDALRHDLNVSIKGTHLKATDLVTLKILQPGARVLPFDLYRTLRVSRVADESGKELPFIQEDKDDDADLAVILPAAPEPGREIKLSIQYEGDDALENSGGGNFILLPRSTWYPNNPHLQFGDRAIFNLTFQYPKGLLLAGTGSLTQPETTEGDVTTARWSSGQTELTVAGFNYGKFKKKSVRDSQTGTDIEFYGNTEVPNELRAIQHELDVLDATGAATGTTLGSISTTKIADQAIADAQNAVRVYETYFGKVPYSRLAMTQQPAPNFGQAWPTLVYMPYLAFLDGTQRTQLLGIGGGTDTFWRYVGPHEVAHQWWGHVVGWKSYRDQWMSEGFAEFSTSLYVLHVRKDVDKFIDFWEEQRKYIVQPIPGTKDVRPYMVGPVTQGLRLSNGRTEAAYRVLVYPKGAYILHMLRMMMYDTKTQDQRFMEMMREFVKASFNKDISTEDFKSAAEKYMTKAMDLEGNGRLDWFFNQWVYGTEIPSYRFEYQVEGNSITGRITQSGVSPGFQMVVPLYLDFGKGWTRLGQATIEGNTSVDVGPIKLPQALKRAAIAPLKDVLAVNIENVKQ